MSLGLFFWILMLLWAIGVAWVAKRDAKSFAPPDVLLFLLLLILGWGVFGAPINA